MISKLVNSSIFYSQIDQAHSMLQKSGILLSKKGFDLLLSIISSCLLKYDNPICYQGAPHAIQTLFLLPNILIVMRWSKYFNGIIPSVLESMNHLCLCSWAQSRIVTAKGHVNEYPTMHNFGNPRHPLSMRAYMILTEYFWKFHSKTCIVGMLLTCPIEQI